MSTACLSFDDLIEINRPQVAEFQRLADMYPDSSDSGVCAMFSGQVRLVEGALTQTYGIAAKFARSAEGPAEVAGIWKEMAGFCNFVLETLLSLKARFPNCGTSELYDLALDYKLACDKRYMRVQEEIACQKSDFPTGIFPGSK